MLKNKKGWVRILEAILAVMILFGVLIVLYSNNPAEIEFSEYIHDLQLRILEDVAVNEIMRNYTLNYSSGPVSEELLDFLDSKIPSQFGFNATICEINALNNCLWENNIQTEVYVEERIISSNFYNYNPKMLRLFIWQE